MAWIDTLDYINVVLMALTFVVTVSALVVYSRYLRNDSFSGLLLLFVATCAFYSFAQFYHFLSHICKAHGVRIAPQSWSWLYLTCQCAEFQTYISGAGLALDRVVLMFYPTTHAAKKFTAKICGLVALLSALSILPSIVSNAFVPLERLDAADKFEKSDATFRIYNATVTWVDAVFLFAVILQIVFGIQFYRYSQVQSVHRKPTKTSQITFIQVISQSTLCLVPKILDNYNRYLHGDNIIWIKLLFKHYSLLYAANLLIVCSFIIERLGRKRIFRVAKDCSRSAFNSDSTHKTPFMRHPHSICKQNK